MISLRPFSPQPLISYRGEETGNHLSLSRRKQDSFPFTRLTTALALQGHAAQQSGRNGLNNGLDVFPAFRAKRSKNVHIYDIIFLSETR